MKKSAIQQAVDMFKRLVNLKTVNAKPLEMMKAYNIATLPGGLILRSTGVAKPSITTKKINQAQERDVQSTAPIGGLPNAQTTAQDLALQIAVPANQMGTAQNRTMALANYVNNILRPKLNMAPGISAPAIVPQLQQTAKFFVPSAVSNLPPLTKAVEQVLQAPTKYNTFLQNAQKAKLEMARRFLSQIGRGEQAAYASFGGQGRIPLVKTYEGEGYYVPAPKSATSASIRPQIPSVSGAVIQ